MKKVFIIALISVASSVFSQTGKVGINTPTPSATLDIQPNAANAVTTATTAEGLLIPRVSRLRAANMGTTPAASTLIYVNSVADGSAAGTTVNVDSVGFYYFNGTAWVKLNAGGGGGTDTSIYAGDGTLASARTVTQNNQNLTFVTGTGQHIVNGTTNMQGEVYKKITTISGNYTVQTGDYWIINTSNNDSAITLPSGQTGRELCFFQKGNADMTFNLSTQPLGQVIAFPQNNGVCLISDGSNWLVSTGY